MQRVRLAAAALLLAACGGSKGLCGGTCAAGQRCDLTNGVCVVDEAPRLTLSAPVDQSQLTTNPLPFEGTASDDEGVPKVEWSVDGATWTEVAVESGKFSGQALLPALDGQPMTFTVRATDRAAQVTTVRAGLSVDDVAPTCEQLSPMPLEVFKTGAVDLRFKVSGYATLDVSLDDKSITPTVAGDELSYSWPVPTEDWVTHKVHLVATDAAGNTCVLHNGFVVDNVPPTITFEQPTEGQVMGLDLFGVQFAFGVSKDGSLVTNTLVDVDDGNGFVQSGIWADHWVVGRDAPMGEDFVPHTIKARATDLAGNVFESDETWVADVVPPRLNILSPSAGQMVNAAGIDVLGRAAVTWSVADGDPQLAVVSPQAMGQSFNPSQTRLSLPTSPTDNGAQYTVELTAVTRTATTSGTVTFGVDRVLPYVAWASPALNSRNVPPGTVATVTFNEPIVRTSAVTGTWSSDGKSVDLPLGSHGDDFFDWADTQYLTDNAGNPLDGGPVRYRTAPVYWAGDPDAGLVTTPGAVSLVAASSQESALAFAVMTNTDMKLYVVDSRDGGIDIPPIGVLPPPDVIRVSSFLRANAIAEDRTWNGVELAYGGTNRYSYLEPDHHDMGGLLTWYVNQAPVAGQPDQGDFSLINFTTLNYVYGSSAGVPIPLTDVNGLSVSPTHWVASQAGADTPWAAYGCDAGSCAFFQTGSFPDAVAPRPYAFSAGASCDLYVYSSSFADGGLVLASVPWTAGCPTSGCAAPSMTTLTEPSAAPVFNPSDYGAFELLTTTGSTFSISTGTLDSACTPTLTPVTSFTVPQGLLDVKPVWMYGKPSALYLDGNSTVRLFVAP